jgi:hypothetical protein
LQIGERRLPNGASGGGEVFVQFLALQTTMVDQQSQDRAFGDLKMLRHVLLRFSRIIAVQHVVDCRERAEQFGRKGCIFCR